MVRARRALIAGLAALSVAGGAGQDSTGPDRPATTPSRSASAKKDKGPSIDQRPYRIRAWVSVAPGTPLDRRGRDRLIAGWRRLIERFVGAAWQLEMADGDGPLRGASLKELTPDSIAPLAPGFDKAWVIEAQRLTGTDGVTFTGREFDAATGQVGLVFSEPVRSIDDAARGLFSLCLEMFSPTAEIGAQSEGGVYVRVQGASIPPASSIGQVVSVGSVFRAARVIYNPDGSVRQLTVIPRTYLRVSSLEGPQARCEIISKLRDPLTRLVRGRYKVVAVGVKPTALPTRLRFITTPPDSRPAAGYTVMARLAPRGPLRVVGTTDREGRVVLEPKFIRGLAMVRLVAGGTEPLDEFPIMPGEQTDERVVVVDPRVEAVTLEARLTALRDLLIDQALERGRLEALLKPRAEAENWDEVRYLLDQYEQLPKRAELEAALEALRTEALETQQQTRRIVLTRTAQSMLNETTALIERYIDDDAFAAYADAYDRYAATAPPEKARARTLPTEREESVLARMAINSASNASQDEARAGLVEYLAPDRSFRLALPPGLTPTSSTRELTLTTGAKVTQQILTFEHPEQGLYTITYFDYDKPPTRESQISKALDSARAMFLSALPKSKVIAERPIAPGGFPGREVEIEVPAAREGEFRTFSRNRALVVGARFYTVSIQGTEAQVRARSAELFLDSFRPLEAGMPSRPAESAHHDADPVRLPAETDGAERLSA
ncbi:MAG: hypothetical protein KatS3mg108_2973 [Isosphaeraceae bacterium]|nr:MAG: hypothetical protein KatS3mg108_2973 [Isosphaeraceae bacterium]